MIIPMYPGANLRALISFAGHHSITTKGFAVHRHAPELCSPRTSEPIQFNMDIIGHGALGATYQVTTDESLFSATSISCLCIHVEKELAS